MGTVAKTANFNSNEILNPHKPKFYSSEIKWVYSIPDMTFHLTSSTVSLFSQHSCTQAASLIRETV